jgi:hypothetical protein
MIHGLTLGFHWVACTSDMFPSPLQDEVI